MRHRFSFFACLVVLMAGLGLLSSCQARSDTPADWTLPDLNGKVIKLSGLKGKVVVLNFWATWCPPCLAEIPDFIELEKKYQGKDVVIIGLSVDDAPPSDVAKFVKKAGINYPVVMAPSEVSEKYGADEGIPITLIISPEGMIAAQHQGIVTMDYLEGHIKKLLPVMKP